MLSPASTLSTYIGYDDTGNVLNETDSGAHVTSFSYTDNFSDGVNRNTLAYPTTITAPQTHSPSAANHASTCKYDVNTGLPVDCADQNGNHTTSTYDSMLRPTQMNFPDGGKTVYTYSGTSQVLTWNYLNSSTYSDFRQHIDGLGRIDRTAFWNPQGTWDMQDLCFDADGRPGFVSYPYENAAGWGNPSVCSGAGDAYSYDGLNRTTRVTHSDGSYASYAYTGRATQTQDEGNGSYNVTRILQADGLGRLQYACEVSSGTLLGSGSTPGSCGLDYAGTGFLSTYGYDTLDNLTHVDQGGYGARTFAFDSLSRLTSESTPEQFGCPTSYAYNADGLLSSRTRPAPNQGSCSSTVTTSYAYDEMHRLRSRSYSDGTTPTATFNYDEGSTWGVATNNAVGRMTTASISNAGQIFPSADAMGRILSTYQCTPRTCGSASYNHSYAYDYLGDVTTFNNAGLYALTYGYNSATRITSVTSNLIDAQHPATILNNASYGAFGLNSDSLGNGLGESFGYAARGALNSYSAGGVYSFNLGLASDYNISNANDSANGNWSYGYDPFNRLASASKSGVSLSWAYDRFGNRWQQNGSGGPTPQFTFDTNNHGAGNSYDVLGNVLNDGYHNYSYDAESRMISVDSSTTYVYDAFGRRVAKQSGGVSQSEYLYDLGGEATAIFNSAGTWAYGEIYAGGRHVATYSGSTTNFLHADWLGNIRVASNVSGGNSESCSDLPFGDNRSCSGTDWSWFHFTGDEHDSESNLEHTEYRQLSSTQGRWLSPDPYSGSMDLANPQSLNRYAYVSGDPIDGTDPLGLYCAVDLSKPCTQGAQFAAGGLEILALAATPTANLGYVERNEAGQILDIGVVPFYGNSAMLSVLGLGAFYNPGSSAGTGSARPSACSGKTSANLNYNVPNSQGETGQQHIENNHMQWLNGQPVANMKSQYLFNPPTPSRNWALVVAINAYTFDHASQVTQRAPNDNIVFTMNMPLESFVPGYQSAGPNFLVGMERQGTVLGMPKFVPTSQNTLVTQSDCTSVRSSYPGRP